MLAPMAGLGLEPLSGPDSSTPSAPPPPPATWFGWKAVAGAAIAVVIGGAALSVALRRPAPVSPSQGVDRLVLVGDKAPAGGNASGDLGSSADLDSQALRAGESNTLGAPAADNGR